VAEDEYQDYEEDDEPEPEPTPPPPPRMKPVFPEPKGPNRGLPPAAEVAAAGAEAGARQEPSATPDPFRPGSRDEITLDDFLDK